MKIKAQKTTIILFLIVTSFAVFWQVGSHDFIAYDDDVYVFKNPYVQKGFSKATITWAFTTFHEANWHPVTWLSHMIDFYFFGLNPKGHHIINLILHTANASLLFYVLTRMTKALWSCAFVATMFAIHPAHVESVAWVAERKDLLSSLFWFLTILAYVKYVERPRLTRYLLVVLTFVLGLMAKPMVVTLPFVLLLLDYWPINRIHADNRQTFRGLVAEKVPLFAISALSCTLTIIAQSKAHAVIKLHDLPLLSRLTNAVIAYSAYIWKMLWPENLAILYPFQSNASMGQIVATCTLIVSLTIGAVILRHRAPYLLVGWLYFLGTLVPVIGVVQVGQQAFADRYTYLPFIGLFVILAWGIPDALKGWRHCSWVLTVSGLCVLLLLSARSWKQTTYWRNSITLFEHTLQVTTDNSVIHLNLGTVLEAQGKYLEAVTHYEEAIRIRPGMAEAHYNLANVFIVQKRFKEAASHYQETLRLKPDYEYAYNNLGVALQAMGKIEEAIKQYRVALRLNPNDSQARSNLDACMALLPFP